MEERSSNEPVEFTTLGQSPRTVAIIGALAVLFGAIIGVTGTLITTDRQLSTQQENSRQDRVRSACTDFLRALDDAIDAVGKYRAEAVSAKDANAKIAALDRVESSRLKLTSSMYPLLLSASETTGLKAREIEVLLAASQNLASRILIVNEGYDADHDGVIENSSRASVDSFRLAQDRRTAMIERCRTESLPTN